MRLRPFQMLACFGLMLMALACRAELREVITKTRPSVVAVGTFSAMANPRFNFRGTGFVVTDGHHVVTNAHVLPATDPLTKDNRLVVQIGARAGAPPDWRDATVETLDPVHDLALLAIEGAALPALMIEDYKNVREGESIAFMGFPIGGVLGFTPVTHHGIISAITAIALPMPQARQLNEKAIRRLREGPFDIYQLDATAYPGNSGGPVLDVDSGEVVGVINMVLVKGSKESALSQPSGISYAVPSRFVADLIKSR